MLCSWPSFSRINVIFNQRVASLFTNIVLLGRLLYKTDGIDLTQMFTYSQLHSLSGPLPASMEAVSSVAFSQLRRCINTSQVLNISISIPLPAPENFSRFHSIRWEDVKVPADSLCRLLQLESLHPSFRLVVVLSRNGKIGSSEAGFQRYPLVAGSPTVSLIVTASSPPHEKRCITPMLQGAVPPCSSICMYACIYALIPSSRCTAEPATRSGSSSSNIFSTHRSHRYTSTGASSKLQYWRTRCCLSMSFDSVAAAIKQVIRPARASSRQSRQSSNASSGSFRSLSPYFCS